MKNKVNSIHNLEKGKNKRKIVIILIIISIIGLICFFIKNAYKNQNLGNNMSNKNIEEIEEYILNISSYRAKIEVTIESNKNTNKYVMEQIYQKGNISKQIILEPSNIEGMEIIYENGNIKINHSKLNLSSIYENYAYIADNFLWLDAFIEDYKENKNGKEATISEENETIIMETKTRNENNRYVSHKKLYIDKKTGKPTKLFVQDINKNNLVYILYNEITVNGLQ